MSSSREATPAPAAGANLPLSSLDRIPRWLGFIAAFSLLLLRQPYRGVRHDATLYAGQALSHRFPNLATADFFFAGGSQDQFTLFTRLLEVMTAHLGMASADFLLLAASRVIAVWAFWSMTEGWPVSRRWLALLCVAGLSHMFGAGHIFQVLEPFVSARSMAEPLAFVALALLLRDRLGWAIAALLLSLVCHPLVGIPAAIVGWFYLIAKDRRWAWAALALVPVVGLAWAGISPFDRLRLQFDAEWFGVISVMNTHVFLSRWDGWDWLLLVSNVAVLLVSLHGEQGPLARLSRASLAATAVLFAVTFVGADLFGNVLITQLQLWRVQSVMHMMFVLWLPTLLLRLWQRNLMGRIAALALVGAITAVTQGVMNSWVLMVWATATWAMSMRGTTLSPAIMRVAFGATVLAVVGLLVFIAYGVTYEINMHLQGTAIRHPASLPFHLAASGVTLFVILLAGAARPGPAGRAFTAVLVAALAVALWQWDQRTPWSRYLEAEHPAPHPFEAAIPPTAQVWWEEGDLAPVWLLLHRPSFAAQGQYSGLLFSRQASLTGAARAPLMFDANRLTERCRMIENSVLVRLDASACALSREALVSFCTRPGPHPDFVVTSAHLDLPPVATWRFDPRDGSRPLDYALYDCAKVR